MCLLRSPTARRGREATARSGAAPAIALEKRTNGQDADEPPGPYVLVGDAVLWEYVVTNTGNVPLTNITVTDDQGVLVSCPQSELEPGGTMVCEASDSATPGPYSNLGTVEGARPTGHRAPLPKTPVTTSGRSWP